MASPKAGGLTYLIRPSDLATARRETVGRPLDAVEARIISPDDGAEQPPGSEGEVQVRVRAQMTGYLDESRQIFPLFSASPTEGELRSHCARLLPPAAVPERIDVVSSLPLSGSGKVRRALYASACCWMRTHARRRGHQCAGRARTRALTLTRGANASSTRDVRARSIRK
jgi:acyl-CoA synthetase (AMP-forming)/AMP-acid ligase II